MPAILCYGDSNTWGYDAGATAAAARPMRHAREVRWTGVAAQALGPDWEIICEGQNGRTTVHDDPLAVACRNGRKHLPVVLESHKPLDAVVLMLGTNDLKGYLNLSPQEVAAGAALLVRIIQQSDAGPGAMAPRVLLVCPPLVGDFAQVPDLAAKFPGAAMKSHALSLHFAAVASQLSVPLLCAGDFVTPSPLDGLHLDAASHAALGSAIADRLRLMI